MNPKEKSMKIIHAQDLVKKFKDFTAVDHVSFHVEPGELFGLLGPNGAGKTTIIRMLTTLLPITSGSAHVAGFDVAKNRSRVRENIGMVFQEPALDRQLTGRENLDFHARMYGMKKDLRHQKIKEVLELVELTEKKNELVNHYSGGMKRRLEIARGLMHSPKVLFLDEPTLGLDAQTRRKIWTYIQTLNESRKTTVILTTHYMEEADFLCQRVGIMDKGKIIVLDTPKNLKDIIGADVVSLEIECGNCEHFRQLDFVQELVSHQNRVDLSMKNGERKIPLLMEFAHSHDIEVRSVELHKPSLEDVFLRYTGTTIRERNSNGERMDPMRMRR
jgi:ABC-2 type transport system ATP-binding protein